MIGRETAYYGCVMATCPASEHIAMATWALQVHETFVLNIHCTIATTDPKVLVIAVQSIWCLDVTLRHYK